MIHKRNTQPKGKSMKHQEVMDTLLNEMKDWIIDCHPEQEQEILEANENAVKAYISKNYDGGQYQFYLDSKAYHAI